MRRGLLAAVLIVSGIALAAQAPEKLPTFEAASIKLSDPAAQGRNIRRAPGGRFTTSNMPVRELVRFAYGVQDFQLDGLPDWTKTESWDITAKAGGDPPFTPPGTPDPMTLMLRSLLMERFKLAAHRETRDMPIYALVRLRPDRLGPELEQSALDCQAIIDAALAAARA